MSKFIISATGVLICLFFARPTLSGSVEKDAEVSTAVASADADLTATEIAKKLSDDYREWVEANLRGAEKEGLKLEESLFDQINKDIFLSEMRVRELARQAALARVGDEGTQPNLSEVTEQEVLFQRGVSLLNTKEALYRALHKSKMFSTKYRLLGDYIDLLRRELQMPRLKLASASGNEKHPPHPEGQ